MEAICGTWHLWTDCAAAEVLWRFPVQQMNRIIYYFPPLDAACSIAIDSCDKQQVTATIFILIREVEIEFEYH